MHLDWEQILVAFIHQIIHALLINIWERRKLPICDFVGLQSLRFLFFTGETGLFLTVDLSRALDLLTVTFISSPGLLEIGSS